MPRSPETPFPPLDEFVDESNDAYAESSSASFRRPRAARRASAPAPSLFEDEYTAHGDVDEDDLTPFDEAVIHRSTPTGAPSTSRATRALPRERPVREQIKERTARTFVEKTHSPRAPRKTTAKGGSRKKAKGFVPVASRTTPRALPFEIAGVLCLTSGAVLLFNTLRASADGWLPRLTVGALRFLFGAGAGIFAGVLCLLGLILIAYRQRTNFRAFARGMGTAFLVFLTAAHLAAPRGTEFESAVLTTHGGAVGGALAWLLRHALGEVGAVVALMAFALVALLLFTEISLADAARGLGNVGRFGAGKVGDALHLGQWRVGVPRKTRIESDEFEDDEEYSTEEIEERFARWSRAPRAKTTRTLPPDQITPFEPIEELLAQAAREPLPEFHPEHSVERPTPGDTESTTDESAIQTPQSAIEEEAVNPIEALEAQARATATAGEENSAFKQAHKPLGERIRFGDGPLMPEYFHRALTALDPPVPVERGAAEEDTARGVGQVEDTLKAFKIDARVTDVKRGPVITRYEVQPAPGVRVAAIANLDRDIARSLSAYAVRIEAPVPGRNVVGIEVPNKKVHLVRMRDVLELPEFLSAQSKLAFVLGKDIAGTSKWADLTKMPHMLIAGATNSGKSVCLNSVIASILLRATPDEVKFSLIDPKRVELTLFRDIPHLYHPVVVEPKDAVRALRGAIAEMDRRYKRFAERGVRNIASYNSKLEEGEQPLPYLVIVIDELADLMMTAAAEFEKLICRLAQLARATGIHLIVATQRPSVNVITGVIKANIPARIAFAVASQVDSRTILDSVGAERLIGSGDMLFDSNTGGKPVRIQGAFLSEDEVNRVVEVVKETYAPVKDEYQYGLDLASVDTDDSGVAGDDDDVVVEKRDDLYDEIKAFVIRYDEMSASMIQRKFEIGYPRAGRIVDQLERDGVLGPADGPKPRKVLGGG
jgi:S-DNA-T family DNA segregation ATPase FtsK/SpoIIIE